jgi:hypothetical protein
VPPGQSVSIGCGGGRIHLRGGVYIAPNATLAFHSCRVSMYASLADATVSLPNFAANSLPDLAVTKANSTLAMTDSTVLEDCVVRCLALPVHLWPQAAATAVCHTMRPTSLLSTLGCSRHILAAATQRGRARARAFVVTPACMRVQIGSFLRSEGVAALQPRPPGSPILFGRPVVQGTPQPWAITVISASFSDGARPTRLAYTNTTAWCAETQEEGDRVIALALAAAAEGPYDFATQAPVRATGTTAADGPPVPSGGGGGGGGGGHTVPVGAIVGVVVAVAGVRDHNVLNVQEQA